MYFTDTDDIRYENAICKKRPEICIINIILTSIILCGQIGKGDKYIRSRTYNTLM